MPIHDWTRVSAGTWHDFHLAWIAELRVALNSGLLPPDYYAQAEQVVGPTGPDVLTLQTPETPTNGHTLPPKDAGGIAVAVATSRPATQLCFTAEMDEYVLKRRTIIVRHNSGDRIVAFLEIVSPGNKGSRRAIETFVEKAVEALYRGYHLLVIDLFPPGNRDPQGIHGAIWGEISGEAFAQPPDEPLTLAAYSAGQPKTAYVEPTRVGKTLFDMPLFLEPESYVNVPLEATYLAAYRGVPRRWREPLERAEA